MVSTTFGEATFGSRGEGCAETLTVPIAGAEGLAVSIAFGVATFDSEGDGVVTTFGTVTVGLVGLTGSETFSDGDARGEFPVAVGLSLIGSTVKDGNFSFREFAAFSSDEVLAN